MHPATNTPVALGQTVAQSLPSWNHALLQKRLLLAIEQKYAGQFSVLPALAIQAGADVLVPDLSIYAGSMALRKPDEEVANDLPLLVIEILSAFQVLSELTEPCQKYLAAGITSCWLVVPPIHTIFLSTAPGDYRGFNRHETLLDPATGIELELAPLFS